MSLTGLNNSRNVTVEGEKEYICEEWGEDKVKLG